jgi:hypothetical protein
MARWMSPNFGPIGCAGAAVLFLLMVLAIAALLYIPWSIVLKGQ